MIAYTKAISLILSAAATINTSSHAFHINSSPRNSGILSSQLKIPSLHYFSYSTVLTGKVNGESHEEENENAEVDESDSVSQEKSSKNSQKDPPSGTVKRKKKNGSQYRVIDNRDNLPFLVKVTTPDPYTNNEEMKNQARKNSKIQKEMVKKSKQKKTKKSKAENLPTRRRLGGMAGGDSIASSIYTRADNGDLHKVLGEFVLDKSTNCGDIIQVGNDIEYQVQRARCQYKYAGGKKFVMTRKILEVKEVKRILVESEVKKLFEMDGSEEIDEPPMLE